MRDEKDRTGLAADGGQWKIDSVWLRAGWRAVESDVGQSKDGGQRAGNGGQVMVGRKWWAMDGHGRAAADAMRPRCITPTQSRQSTMILMSLLYRAGPIMKRDGDWQ
jgi:hypothetical protein